jgi:uncharacterized protein (TIGR01777 family)
MTKKTIVVTGGTGLIGKQLCKTLLLRGYNVKLLSRNPLSAKKILPEINEIIYWNDYENKDYSDILIGAYAVIHLSGANVAAKRWTDKYKDTIYKSREISTRLIVNSIGNLTEKPEVVISSSAIGIYGNRGDEKLDEYSSLGDDFLSNVCKVWEFEANKVEKFGVRNVTIRTGIVLSKEGGALKKMLLPFKLFLGGPLGSGKQGFSWIHIDDIVNLYIYTLENKNVIGAVNGTSPNPISMKGFSKTLGKILFRPSIFNVPEFILRFMLGEGASAVLASQFVYPKRTIELGYKFSFDNLFDALRNLLK